MWQKHREFIDGQTGAHVQVLHNTDTGAEHITQIMLGHRACPHCGAAHGPLDEVDPKEKVAADLAMLNAAHERMVAYAAKHRVTIRGIK